MKFLRHIIQQIVQNMRQLKIVTDLILKIVFLMIMQKFIFVW